MPIKSCNSESDWLPDAWTPWLLFYFPIQFNRRVQRRPKNVINEAGEALALRSTSQIKLVLPYIATIWADQRTSVLVLFGCSLKNQRRKKETFASNREREQKKCLLFPCVVIDLQALIQAPVLNHPRVQSQPVLPTSLFRPAPKIIESVLSQECQGAPISPLVFLLYPFFPPTFSAPLFSPLSVFLWLFFFSFPLNLRLPPIPHCKAVFCTALMERLLSNKDRSQCGTAATNRIFCGPSEGALSSAGDREGEKKGEGRKRESLSQIYPSKHLQLSEES